MAFGEWIVLARNVQIGNNALPTEVEPHSGGRGADCALRKARGDVGGEKGASLHGVISSLRRSVRKADA